MTDDTTPTTIAKPDDVEEATLEDLEEFIGNPEPEPDPPTATPSESTSSTSR